MKKKLFIQFTAFLLMVLTMSTSLNLPVIEHECNFSKMKSYHFFSVDECHDDHCHKLKKISEGEQFNKVPCCTIHTTFVNNEQPVVLKATLSYVQVAIITEIFNLVKAPLKFNFFENPVPFEHHKLYGYKYRIAMQSFLC